MKRYFEILAVFVALVIFFGIVGFFVLPPISKPFLIKDLSKTLNREVALEKISVNPFALTSIISGVTIKEPGQEKVFVSFDEFLVNIYGLPSIFKRSIIIKEIRLTRPYVNIARHEDGTYNFSDLIPKEKPPEKEK